MNPDAMLPPAAAGMMETGDVGFYHPVDSGDHHRQARSSLIMMLVGARGLGAVDVQRSGCSPRDA